MHTASGALAIPQKLWAQALTRRGTFAKAPRVGFYFGALAMKKSCSKCSKEKPLEEFDREGKVPDGRRAECMACRSVRHAKYRKGPDYHREWRKKNAEKVLSYRRAMRKRNPEHFRARGIVQNAINRGRLVRPDSCGLCMNGCKPEAHHKDYGKPLEVDWLCRSCHLMQHK